MTLLPAPLNLITLALLPLAFVGQNLRSACTRIFKKCRKLCYDGDDDDVARASDMESADMGDDLDAMGSSRIQSPTLMKNQSSSASADDRRHQALVALEIQSASRMDKFEATETPVWGYLALGTSLFDLPAPSKPRDRMLSSGTVCYMGFSPFVYVAGIFYAAGAMISFVFRTENRGVLVDVRQVRCSFLHRTSPGIQSPFLVLLASSDL